MCEANYSESGALCSIDGCAEFRRLMDHKHDIEDELAAMRQERDEDRARAYIAEQKETAVHLALNDIRQERDALIQVSADVCPECGWAMKFPDEPCRNCEVHTLRQELDALLLVREKADALAESVSLVPGFMTLVSNVIQDVWQRYKVNDAGIAFNPDCVADTVESAISAYRSARNGK